MLPCEKRRMLTDNSICPLKKSGMKDSKRLERSKNALEESFNSSIVNSPKKLVLSISRRRKRKVAAKKKKFQCKFDKAGGQSRDLPFPLSATSR